jgi:GT2 family glycosyltransferase/Tfp pilus assembly protein PilF
MPVRYLFGAVSADFARNYFSTARQEGHCRVFGHEGADLALDDCVTWDEVSARLGEWQADVLILYPPYNALPAWWTSCPLPRVVLALDANLHPHAYRLFLPACEVALADGPSACTLKARGIERVRPALLYGTGSVWEPFTPVEQERNLDIVFAGNTHVAIQGARLSWLDRLARLSGKYRVRIVSNVFGEAYRKLLGRARVVFNRSIRGEANQRTFEVLAAGALLFQEADNGEVASILEPGQDFAPYTDENLEAQLERYLGDENLRQEVAKRGQAKLASFTFATQWQRLVEQLETELPSLQEHATKRTPLSDADLRLVRLWQTLSGGKDARLRGDLLEVFEREPDTLAGYEATIGLLTLVCQAGGVPDFPLLARLDQALGRHLERQPHDLLVATHRVALSLRLSQFEEALHRTAFALRIPERAGSDAALERLPPPVLGFDWLRGEWDRAAWTPPAEGERTAKVRLLRWWLHTLLGQYGGNKGDLPSAYEAVLARPDLPTARGVLGGLLVQANRPDQALPHLRQALASNPLDRVAADLLHRALVALRDHEGLRELQESRRLWHAAAPELVPAEAWWQVQALPATPAAPPQPLVSIVILCCNAVEVTRGCLDSLLARTHSPYELILIDNASTDDTLAYLKTLPGRLGPQRWIILRNEINRGFAGGCNQGLLAAQGELVCFLNNDTILPSGWLEGLRAALVSGQGERPVGMVGPVSNFTLPTQTVPPGYNTTGEFATFAAQRARDFAGRHREVEVLSGFCLLARKDALMKLTGFDERFGIGMFEDNDLSLRVRQAGYQLRVAEGVYLHHHGSKTFQALGIDPRAQQARNEQIFRAKWFPQNGQTPTTTVTPAGTLTPTPVPVATPVPNPVPGQNPIPVALPVGGVGRKPRFTLSMIVKNEEANLAACVGPLYDLFDEIVINDTGSTDGTVTLAKSLGPKVKVIENPWKDSFCLARNQSLDAATGDYVFWMDADDRLDLENVQKLRALLARLGSEPVAFSMKVWCVPRAGEAEVGTVVNHVRLFPRSQHIRWEHRIHEQILMPLRRAGVPVHEADIVIQHVGYQDPALVARKTQRDLHLLHLDLADRPDSPFVQFNLGVQLLTMGRPREALAHLEAALLGSDPTSSITRKLFALAGQAHRQLGDPVAAERVLTEGLKHCPGDAEILFYLSECQRERGDRRAAIATLEQLLTTRSDAQFASVDAGLRGYKGAHNLATLYLEEGRWPQAETLWRQVTAQQPNFADGWAGLAEVCLVQGKRGEAEQALTRLEALGCAEHAERVRRAHPAQGPG